MSITKRHYNNGYYIAHSNGKPSGGSVKENGKFNQVKTEKTTFAVKNRVNEKVISDYTDQNSVPNGQDLSARIEAKRQKVNVNKPVHSFSKYRNHITILPVSPIENKIQKVKKASGESAEKDALSLFLAGGFGLGGFINLLLVVALILLILWLFRIV